MYVLIVDSRKQASVSLQSIVHLPHQITGPQTQLIMAFCTP